GMEGVSMAMRIILCLFSLTVILTAADPKGFQGADWGSTPAEVQGAVPGNGWNRVEQQELFPTSPDVIAYGRPQTIAGYPAQTTFYFYEEQFFQITISFDFSRLEEYDFNYNVFISVDEYYREIRSTTTTFVNDIYTLLREKYGRKQPVFKGIDPRNIFMRTDNYLAQERWNLRYNPSEYYKRIIARAYALWKYPETEITFAINISAADERFEYTLSATSQDLTKEIKETIRQNRSRGL
ncbi:MAG: hypothetical protein ACQEQV_09535, partial [Fibrobacterota bacterium]